MNFSLKSVLVLAALTPLASLAFADAQSNKAGVFRDVQSYKTSVLDAKSCKKSGGDYLKSEKLCLLKDGGTTIEISKTEPGKYYLSISSVGTNSHTCGYEGEAQETNSNQIVSKEVSESEPCEVTVSFKDENTISVDTNENCKESCSYEMSMDTENAHRVK